MTAGFREPLSKDPLGWQIDDDPVAEEALRSIEAFGMIFAEVVFHRLSRAGFDPFNPDLDLGLRSIGSLAGRVAMSRLTWQTGIDEQGVRRVDSAGTQEALAAGERMRAILNWLFVWDLTEPDAPPQLRPPAPPPPIARVAIQDLWAAMTYLDRRARNQGAAGPGRRRTIIRETTRRTST